MGYVQIKNLYVNGCSWTDGNVLDYTGLIQYLGLEGTGRNYSYPTLVANEFEYNLIDESRYGGSINRIVRMCWEYIISKHNNIQDTIFILEIPNGFRDEIYSNQHNKYFNITGGLLSNPQDKTEEGTIWDDIRKNVIDNYYNFNNFDEFFKKEYINLMSLLFYIKQKNASIYLIQPNDIINRHGLYDNLINYENIIKLSDNTFHLNEYDFIQDMCKNEKLSIGDELNNGKADTHPGISGHKKLSEIIIKHLIKYESNIIQR
jgi:hypothetical protein